VPSSQKFFSTVRYIVRNPVKAGLSTTPAEYRYSGHASVLTSLSSIIDKAALLSYFSPDIDLALKRYRECTEYEGWTAQVGFATIVDHKKETTERLGCLLDQLLAEKDLADHRNMIVSGAKSPLSRNLRSSFIHLAFADGHSLKDIAAFLHVSHETVRWIGKQTPR